MAGPVIEHYLLDIQSPTLVRRCEKVHGLLFVLSFNEEENGKVQYMCPTSRGLHPEPFACFILVTLGNSETLPHSQ